MKPPFSVYSTWGFHDELGDVVELSAELAMTALDTLERWQRDFGLRQDYFHLDAFWFDPELGYKHFKRSHWPDGFEPVRRRVAALGMTPGLWYSVNGNRLEVAEWAASATGRGSYSLADGPYADCLLDSLLFAAREWGVRLYKFDFADFWAAAQGVERAPEESYRLNVAAFRRIVRALRAEFPDIHVITHCGFDRQGPGTLLGSPQVCGADLALLDAVDAVFSGDPHPFDAPQTALCRNLDVYQDRQVWRKLRDGVPIDRIEDHGALMATTNTAGYRGRVGFARTHLGQLARGGRRDMYYGDPRLLTDDDLGRMKLAREAYFDLFRDGLTTAFVGAGEPGLAPWHGYLTGGGGRGLLYLVNPHLSPVTAELDIPALARARVVFHDGLDRPAAQVQPDRLTVALGPEQMAVIGLGETAMAALDLGSANDPPLPRRVELLPLTWHSTGGGLTAAVDSLPTGARLHVVAQAHDGGPQSLGPAAPFRFGAQMADGTSSMAPATHEQVTIAVNTGSGDLPPAAQVPAVAVWAGISWVSRTFDLAGPGTLTIRQSLNPPRRLRVVGYAVQW